MAESNEPSWIGNNNFTLRESTDYMKKFAAEDMGKKPDELVKFHYVALTPEMHKAAEYLLDRIVNNPSGPMSAGYIEFFGKDEIKLDGTFNRRELKELLEIAELIEIDERRQKGL